MSWNVHNATESSRAWDYLRELNPDVALLQEVRSIPRDVESDLSVISRPTVRKNGLRQRFLTALLVRDPVDPETYPLISTRPWVQAELDRFGGNLVAAPVKLPRPVVAVAVYSPAWPIDPTRLAAIDTSDVRMLLHPRRSVSVGDLLLSAIADGSESPLVVGGDFNLSETFDSWRARGNREYLDRMAACGLVDCLRHAKGCLTPTFRNARGARSFTRWTISSSHLSCWLLCEAATWAIKNWCSESG